MKNTVEKLNRHRLEYQKTGSFIPLLIFLEHSVSEVKELIASLNFDDFPYSRLVEFAVSGESGYWTSLAIDWLEQNLPLNEEITNAISLMVKDKRASQTTRHRAFQLVKRFERSRIA